MAALLSLHNKKSSFHEEEEKGGTSASLPWTPQLQHCLSVATCANRFGELIACPDYYPFYLSYNRNRLPRKSRSCCWSYYTHLALLLNALLLLFVRTEKLRITTHINSQSHGLGLHWVRNSDFPFGLRRHCLNTFLSEMEKKIHSYNQCRHLKTTGWIAALSMVYS